MKSLFMLFMLFIVQCSLSQQKFQLAQPMLKYKSAFFTSITSFEVVFDQPGAEVRYTLNGNEPTANDLLYSTPIAITKRTQVKVKTFGNNFLPSETVSATFVKNGRIIKQIQYSKPNESYNKSKPDILNDNIGGFSNYRSGTWLGYDNDTVTMEIDLIKKETINTILISLLQDENSWIFLPEQILVYYYNDRLKTFLAIGKEEFTHNTSGPKQSNLWEIKPTQNIKNR